MDRGHQKDLAMAMIALVMFIGLFAFGTQILGYSDVDGMVRLALLATFVFGLICGIRVGR